MRVVVSAWLSWLTGSGGWVVEVLKWVYFRSCRCTGADAAEMLAELRGVRVLCGARGRACGCVDAVIDILLKIGGEQGLLTNSADEIAEIDINPIIVTAEAATAVDARFILQQIAKG